MPTTRRALLGALLAPALAAGLGGLLVPPPAAAAAPLAVLQGDTPETTVFPDDRFTVPDPAQLTGKRVDLPQPDCSAGRSPCDAVAILNTADGFDLQPRFFVPFTGDVDVATVTPQTVYVEGDTAPDGTPVHVGLQEITFDPAQHLLAARTRDQLHEQRTYTLVVTRLVRGTDGQALSAEVRVPFTTMSATTELARLRDALDDGSAYAQAGITDRSVSFTQPGLTDPTATQTTVFPPTDAERITRLDQRTTDPQALTSSTVPNLAVTGAACYAFGSVETPQFARDDSTIAPTPTTRTPAAVGKARIGFALIVPSGPMPAGGWPTAVYGPGFTRSYFDLFVTSDFNASRGIATLATDPLGHGYGPHSQVQVGDGAPFLAYGRGVDLNGDGTITESEGSQPATVVTEDAGGNVVSEEPSPNQVHGLRGGLEQTAVDNMALVRAVEAGISVPSCPLGGNGGDAQLRPSGVQYYGLSFGGIYGTMLMGTDTHVRSGLLNVGGGPIVDIARLSGFRPLLGDTLRTSQPSLLNGGPGRDGFTESWPLPYDPPITDPVPGAMTVQRYLADALWYGRPGGPEPYAPLLRKEPRLDAHGQPLTKNVLYQVAFGDNTVPNVASGNIIRAGDLFDRVTYYRNDKTPTSTTNPHGFLADPTLAGRQNAELQLTQFLSTGEIVDPDGPGPVFETPIADPDNLQCLHYPHPQTGQGAFDDGHPSAGECGPRPVDRPQVRTIDRACPPDRVPPDAADDDDGNTHEASIDCVLWYGIAQGTAPRTYAPLQDVTRGQMASFIAREVRQAGGTLDDSAPDAFTDDDGDTHEADINALKAAGIVDGKTSTTYDPAGTVTRGQMARFLVRAHDYTADEPLTASADYFRDDDGSIFEDDINKSAEAGLTAGRDSGYEPAGTVRRDAMASFLARLLDRFVEEGTTTVKA